MNKLDTSIRYVIAIRLLVFRVQLIHLSNIFEHVVLQTDMPTMLACLSAIDGISDVSFPKAWTWI
jgi:hypothetical protein